MVQSLSTITCRKNMSCIIIDRVDEIITFIDAKGQYFAADSYICIKLYYIQSLTVARFLSMFSHPYILRINNKF